jgi:hypothetical protein
MKQLIQELSVTYHHSNDEAHSAEETQFSLELYLLLRNRPVPSHSIPVVQVTC